KAFGAANRFLIKSLYMVPVTHDLNMLTNWSGGRGWDWVNPYGYGRLYRNYTKAARMIASNHPEWLDSLREGASSPYAAMQTHNFTQVLNSLMIHDIAKDPATWGQ